MASTKVLVRQVNQEREREGEKGRWRKIEEESGRKRES